ncbi:unnamed protein product [Heterobilharzia americana]|nr:unnamed protein product [Heterobilharzia americana]
MFLKLLNSLHICTLIICTSLLHSHGAENFSHGAHGVLIANTVDGSFVGVDIESGREVWRIDGPPLVSQSLSDLQLMTKTKSYSIVPSLEGQLFLMERRITGDLELSQEASLKALPLNIDSLFSSNFMLTEDSILTGGRDHSTFAFNPHDGKIKYNCTRDGCSSSDTDRKFSDETSYAKGPMIIAYRVNNIVRAISAPVGIEKWNLSVYQYDLCLLTGRIPTPTAAVQKPLPICNMPLNTPNIHGDFMDESFVDVDEPDWDFGLEKRMITARTKDTHPEDLWSFNFSSRISKAWIYRRDLQSLRSLSLFTYDRAAVLLVEKLNESKEKTFTVRNFGLLKEKGLNLLNRKRTHFSTNKEKNKCPSHDRLIYLGSLNGQLYVQVGDGADLPSPDMINLSKSLSVPSGGLLDEHGVPGYSSLIGYYHASYSKSPKLRTSIQPFLSDDNVEETIEKATALGFPNSVGQFKHIIGFQPDTSNEQIVSQSNSADVDASDGSSGLPERIFDSANDLIMLLLRASEIAINHSPIDTESGRSLGFSLSTHFIQLIVVAGMLYFTAQWIMNVKITYDTQLRNDSFYNKTCDLESVVVKSSSSSGSSTEATILPSCSTSDILQSCTTNQFVAATHITQPSFTSPFEIDFKFIRRLGRGGFGQVFEVENRLDGCRYAIKRIRMNEVDDDKNIFLREVKALATLDHPGIVRYHRAWKEYPPAGWQESRDAMMMDFSDDLTSKSDSTECGNDENCFSNTISSSLNLGSYHLSSSLAAGGSIGSNSFSSYKPSKAYSDDDSLIVFENNCSSETLSCTDSDIPKHSVDKKILKAQHKNEVKYTCYLYIQMQLCSPKSLRDWLVAHSLPESRPLRAELICMFRQIVDAVSYLHNHSLMHRDLKPSNILFDLTNRLKLADFGLVTSMLDEKLNQKDASFISYSNQNNQSLYSEMTTENRSIHNAEHNNFADRQIHPLKDISSVQQKRSVFARRHTDHVGTDLYMSPEQERGDNYNHKVDIFSLGLIFLELLITFSTSMERIYTLTRAKQQKLPKDFITCNPVEVSLCIILPSSERSNGFYAIIFRIKYEMLYVA